MTFGRPAAPQRQLPFPFRRQFDWAASAEADVAFGYAGSRRSPLPLACLPRISESARTLEWAGAHSPLLPAELPFFALAAVREFWQLLDRGPGFGTCDVSDALTYRDWSSLSSRVAAWD